MAGRHDADRYRIADPSGRCRRQCGDGGTWPRSCNLAEERAALLRGFEMAFGRRLKCDGQFSSFGKRLVIAGSDRGPRSRQKDEVVAQPAVHDEIGKPRLQRRAVAHPAELGRLLQTMAISKRSNRKRRRQPDLQQRVRRWMRQQDVAHNRRRIGAIWHDYSGRQTASFRAEAFFGSS